MVENKVNLCYNNQKKVEEMGIMTMHKIISNYVNEYCEQNFIDESEKDSKKFEYFINYCIAYTKYCDDIDILDLTTDEDDAGIDGIIFVIDSNIVTTVEEAKTIFSGHKKNLEVEILFIQTKTGDSYERGEILKFGDGVFDFVSDDSNLPQGSFLKDAKKIFDCIIDNVSKIQNGRPDAYLKYVCTSNNDIAREIEATRKNIVKKVNATGFFNKVEMDLYGLTDVMNLWENTKRTSSATINTIQTAPFPSMKGVDEAYIALVSIKEFIEKVLTGEEGKHKTYIYEENVRAFLGEENPVNDKIKSTLESEEKVDKFAIYNNGITIISPDVRTQSNRISFEDYQIVNGCQTSNVLFACRDNISDSALITVKIIEATDPDIIADIVRATNSQSKVDENQFLSFSPFVRRLEKYFEATEDIDGKEIKLYFERRNGQYKNTAAPKKRIFSICETSRAVGALFLNVPDMTSRYPNKFVNQMKDKLFDERNKEEAFYAAAVADFRFKQLSTKGKLLNSYVIYKWHILTIFGYLVNGINPPSLKNQSKVNSYANKILKVCCDEQKCIETFAKAVEVIETIGLKSGRDEVRSTLYSNQVREYCNRNLLL